MRWRDVDLSNFGAGPCEEAGGESRTSAGAHLVPVFLGVDVILPTAFFGAAAFMGGLEAVFFGAALAAFLAFGAMLGILRRGPTCNRDLVSSCGIEAEIATE